jgi:hypothetical protein
LQVIRRADLARRVTIQRQQRVIAVHAVAVVGHADLRLPAIAHRHVHARRAGVKRVLDQLLHHRCRPLHHLARGDLVGQRIRQDVNATRHVPSRRMEWLRR